MIGWFRSRFLRSACVVAAMLLCAGLQAWYIHREGTPGRFVPAVQAARLRPDSAARCAVCHPGVCQDMEDAPHARTLREGHDASVMARFAGRAFQPQGKGPTVTFEERHGQLWMKSDTFPDAMRVDWIFGSGRHALTPVSLLTNPRGQTELLEGAVSWFRGDVLGPTPGAMMSGTGAEPGGGGISSLGSPQDHTIAQECFGCHVTSLPMERGAILSESLVRGVSCERCHPGSERHAESMEQGGPTLLRKWSDLTPLESVNRCGECHRRADHLTREELRPERTVLVRFASVGLAMSGCFLAQDQIHGDQSTTRLDCLTCHDPHRSAEEPPEFFVARCRECHSPQPSRAGECTSPQTTSNCLPCHMPPVRVTENLVLTDHWIRVRKPTDPPVAQPSASHPPSRSASKSKAGQQPTPVDGQN